MTTLEELSRFIERELIDDHAGVEPDEDLLDRGTLDSAGVAHLLAFLEDRYAIEVSDEDLVPENFQSVRAISELVSAKRRLQHA